jgi:hypothetical integral membrane protein (TIGR02206 family)
VPQTYAPFVTFGPSHLTVLAFCVILPLVMAGIARLTESRGFVRMVRFGFAAAIAGIWAVWYGAAYRAGWLDIGNALPLDLCSWAAIATVIALIGGRQRAYELAYFWALAGTLQGLLTPDTPYDFPEIRFIVFSVFHGGIIAAVLFMTVGMKLRPYPRSVLRVIVWSLIYAVCAGMADWLLGTNYGFLRAKPGHVSLFDIMPAWPWYLPVLVGLGMFSALFYYLPFLVIDRLVADKKKA